MPSRDSPSSNAAEVLDRFRQTLERLRPGPTEVFDEMALADPRAVIVEALAAAWSGKAVVSCSPAEVQGWLAAIAQFQPNVGEPVLDRASETARRMADARKRGETVDGASIAAGVAAQADAEQWAARQAHLSAAVQGDRTKLLGLLVKH